MCKQRVWVAVPGKGGGETGLRQRAARPRDNVAGCRELGQYRLEVSGVCAATRQQERKREGSHGCLAQQCPLFRQRSPLRRGKSTPQKALVTMFFSFSHFCFIIIESRYFRRVGLNSASWTVTAPARNLESRLSTLVRLRNWFLRVMSQWNRRDSQGSLTSLVSIYIPPSSTRRGSLYSGPRPLFGPFASLSLP